LVLDCVLLADVVRFLALLILCALELDLLPLVAWQPQHMLIEWKSSSS